MKNWLRWLGLGSGGLLHLAAFVGLLRGGSLAEILLAHVVGSGAWGYGTMLLLPVTQRTAWWLPAGCAAVLPLVGLLAALAFVLELRRPPVDRSDRRYVIWNEQPQSEWEPLPAGAAGQSIVEILQSPRTQLRRNAVLALRELDPQMAIPLLRKGLQDSDEQVRIYAQNILSAMLERFEGGIKELELQLRANPSAAVPARRLAEQFFELVYLDVAGDDETAAHYLVLALALLERAAAAAPDDPEIGFLGLRYSLRARDAATARRWCGRLDAATLESQHVLPWLMELAFLEGHWAELRAQLLAFSRARFFNPRIDDVTRFWMGHAKSAP